MIIAGLMFLSAAKADWMDACRDSFSAAVRVVRQATAAPLHVEERRWLTLLYERNGPLELRLAMVDDQALTSLEHRGLIHIKCGRCDQYAARGYVALTRKGRRFAEDLAAK